MNPLLLQIVERAASLEERLTNSYRPSTNPEHDAIRAARLTAWAVAVGEGDSAKFNRRLGWSGLDAAGAGRAVTPAHLVSEAQKPTWSDTLASVIDLSSQAITERCLAKAKPIPFEEVLVPFVVWARTGLLARARDVCSRFSSEALAQLERSLLRGLSLRAARCLALEFKVSGQASALDALTGNPEREHYLQFVAGLKGDGLASFFLEYSALARVLCRTAELWLDATLEFLLRFEKDRDEIAEWLGIDQDFHVATLSADLSDPHCGLRTVLILGFSSGQHLVYKPRPLRIESAWNRFLEGLESPLDFFTFSVLERDSYGWAQHVGRRPAHDSDEAERYFERAGGLLALLYVLGSTDCHAENLLQAREHPTLIDLETLLSPEIRSHDLRDDLGRSRSIEPRARRSVHDTYLLPIWASDEDGLYDGSGLGAGDPEPPLCEQWLHVNTDQMRLGKVKSTPLPFPQLLDGTRLRAQYYKEAVLNGFEIIFQFLIRARQRLLGVGGLAEFSSSVVRFIFRNTSIYIRFLDELNHPQFLRDGAERSIRLEQLAKAALAATDSDESVAAFEIFSAEKTAIDRGDIPYFCAQADDRSLLLESGRELIGFFGRSALQGAVECLRDLKDSDLRFPKALISSALESASGSENITPKFSKSTRPDPWLESARGIARTIAAHAITKSVSATPLWMARLHRSAKMTRHCSGRMTRTPDPDFRSDSVL